MIKLKNQTDRVVHLHYYHDDVCRASGTCSCKLVKREISVRVGGGRTVRKAVEIKVPKAISLPPRSEVGIEKGDPILQSKLLQYLVRSGVLSVAYPKPKSRKQEQG